MSRYLGSALKKCRRYGMDLELKSGVRSIDSKCKISQAPGVHGDKKGGRPSDFGLHQTEKQKVRYMYGLTERQFRRFYALALRMKGATGSNLVRLLESRLDNVVYRMGFAVTRAEARQMVSHGLILLNGHAASIPSMLVKAGDQVQIKEKARKHTRVNDAIQIAKDRTLPDWVSVNTENYEGCYARVPDRSEVLPDINDNLIVEFYSK